jgi:hypothetical protein
MRVQVIVIVGFVVGAIAAWCRGASRPSPPRFDAELARLIDRATLELVQERLGRDTLPVRMRVGHGLRGPALRLRADDLWIRLRLYHEPPAATLAVGDEVAVHLAGIRWAGGRGWLLRIHTAGQPCEVLGWHLDIRSLPQPVPAGPAPRACWWQPPAE